MRAKTQRFDPRQVMHRPDYEIFHYHDPKMEEVPLHHHDFYEVYSFVSGKADYLVEGIRYTLSRGDLLLISPMDLHRPLVAQGEAYERIVLWINAEYLESISPARTLRERFDTGRCIMHCAHTRLPELMERLASEFSSDAPGSELSARGLFFLVMAELLRLTADSGDSTAVDSTAPDLVREALHYIGDHFREEMSLESLAARFFVSKYHLSHLFRSTVGVSLYRYILLKRLQHARQLLLEGEAPGEAGRESGFQDYTNFYRAFRQVYGISPQEAQLQAERQPSV